MEGRLQLAKDLGATHTINTANLGSATLKENVLSIRPGGVSSVIDTTGVPNLIEESFHCTEKRGKLIFIGVPPHGYNFNINVTEHMNVSTNVLSLKLTPSDLSYNLIEWPLGHRMYRRRLHPKQGSSFTLFQEPGLLLTYSKAVPQMIKWYREGRFPLDKLVQFFQVCVLPLLGSYWVS